MSAVYNNSVRKRGLGKTIRLIVVPVCTPQPGVSHDTLSQQHYQEGVFDRCVAVYYDNFIKSARK